MQLREEIHLLQEKLLANKEAEKPETPAIHTQHEEVDESAIEKAVKTHIEENERLADRNRELEERLSQLLGEYAVMKQDSELIKSKARQLLIDKDAEIEKIKKQKGVKFEEVKKDENVRTGKDTGSMGDSGASHFQEQPTEMQSKVKPMPVSADQMMSPGLHLS